MGYGLACFVNWMYADVYFERMPYQEQHYRTTNYRLLVRMINHQQDLFCYRSEATANEFTILIIFLKTSRFSRSQPRQDVSLR